MQYHRSIHNWKHAVYITRPTKFYVFLYSIFMPIYKFMLIWAWSNYNVRHLVKDSASYRSVWSSLCGSECSQICHVWCVCVSLRGYSPLKTSWIDAKCIPNFTSGSLQRSTESRWFEKSESIKFVPVLLTHMRYIHNFVFGWSSTYWSNFTILLPQKYISIYRWQKSS